MTVLRRCINLLSSRRTNSPFINIEEPFILLLIQIEMCGRDFFPTHLYLDHLHLIGLFYSHSLLSGATAGLIHPIVVLLDGASKSGGMVIPKGEVEREKKKKGRSALRRLQHQEIS